MCPCGQVVRRLICNQKIPSSNLGGGFLALAQLAERWTVIVFFVVIHRSLVRFQQARIFYYVNA